MASTLDEEDQEDAVAAWEAEHNAAICRYVGQVHEQQVKEKIENALRQVIDPETSMDVMRMQLVKNLIVNENGFGNAVLYNYLDEQLILK
jgi:hypothetical protein